MNNLFTRTLLWLIATVVLTFLALGIAATLDMDPGERRRGPFGTLVSLQLAEARHAYETGGRPALEAAIERFREATDSEGILTDATGRDLLTDEHRYDLIELARSERRGPFWRRNRTVVVRRSEDRKYTYFILLDRRNITRWFLQPEANLTVLAVLSAISYAFARRITNPVRDLQRVVERFGRGDLRTRAGSSRKDELGALAHAFDQMADRIEVLLAAQRQLLSDISHELRSPLARLRVALELARMDENRDKHLDRIEKEGERLNALVAELLQVTRAEGDASRMRRETVQLDALVEEIVSDARVEADARKVEIALKRKDSVSATGDPELLRRAVENVLRNALRYAPPGSTVDVALERVGGEARMCVRDCGPGVPPEQLARIFEPFYRVEADRSRETGGTGLGLAIARRAVELHGGRIEALDAAPGLRVEIRLPI